ncbi:MAG: type II toxin-antitoxin system HicA family toxin [Nanoarchaeota archaeon]|nr:type II toxin-antitoxin system HicA family toxin [Nanoarchaeota archaeon]MBU1501570.1 type II toxin-antitoxin system HicA family toxin [Nanoarchaeota archaeon]MBU2458997.1 type II toxin-antitoxin system HicA family toxin [Nanoarchaeota archaeon]MBU2616542.1 type II toxin-antitoxin system HicA family toxin [Nanoarchaeota archaeon]
MTKLPILSGKKVTKVLLKLNYRHVRTRGSHMIFVRQSSDGKKTIPVPNHKELAKGTLKAIMEQASLKLEDLLNLL